MIVEPVLIDAGPLVALLHSSDRRHEECRQQASELFGQLFTSWAVIAEAAWLLRSLPNSLERLLAAIDDHDIEVFHVPQDSFAWLKEQAQQYHDLKPQIADLTLLYLAQHLNIEHIFTLDRRDFVVYRNGAGKPFHLLPESLGSA